MYIGHRLWLGSSFASLVATISVAAPPNYTLVDIHSFQSGSTLANSAGESIDSSGCFICGQEENLVAQAPVFIWDDTGSPTVMYINDEDTSTSKSWDFQDVNNVGIAVGSSIPMGALQGIAR